MDVFEAIRTRQSCRRFLDRPVPFEIVRDILDTARWSPSGTNVQPWFVHVLTGAPLHELTEKILCQPELFPGGEGAEYYIHPPGMGDPYRARQYAVARQLYGSVGIERGDKAGRTQQFVENFRFFRAPVGLFFSIDRIMDKGAWGDIGMFIQSVMLAARGHGLHTCPQQAWAHWPKTVGKHLKLAENQQLYCGMSMGYMDEDHPVNSWRTERQEVEEFTVFSGFEDALGG